MRIIHENKDTGDQVVLISKEERDLVALAISPQEEGLMDEAPIVKEVARNRYACIRTIVKGEMLLKHIVQGVMKMRPDDDAKKIGVAVAGLCSEGELKRIGPGRYQRVHRIGPGRYQRVHKDQFSDPDKSDVTRVPVRPRPATAEERMLLDANISELKQTGRRNRREVRRKLMDGEITIGDPGDA